MLELGYRAKFGHLLFARPQCSDQAIMLSLGQDK